MVFQIFAKIEMMWKNMASILKRYNIVIFFRWNMVVISVCIHGVEIIKKFRWESGFLNPLALGTNGSESTLVT